MRVNKNEFEDGKKYFLYLNNFVLDGSGNCDLQMTDNIDHAVKFSRSNKIYEVELKEIEIEEKEVKTTKKIRIVKK